MAEESNRANRRSRGRNESYATPGGHRFAQSSGILVNEASSLLEPPQPDSLFGSNIFKFPEFPGTNWHLSIYPGGRNYFQPSMLSVSIHMSVTFPVTKVFLCTF
uniref:MATH domain-containing protein n=1 Tax=Angiostrongylus cantonensis TaxID=6313 RepID=A0A0K0D8T9_ANGCA